MSSPSDVSLIAFKAINNFVNTLCEVFGERQHSLVLYKHLLSKTTLSHEEAIAKHIGAFKDFCVSNGEVILTHAELCDLNTHVVTYSEKVKIDFEPIFKEADSDTKKVIWKHLLTISALVDPSGRAKQVLVENRSKNGESEADFLTDIIGKIEGVVDPTADPMQAISGMMQSGVINDLISGLGSGLQDGSLDMGKLMGSVQTMVGGMDSGKETPAGGMDIQGMMSQMMPMMQGLNPNSSMSDAGGGASPPDLMAMLGPMMAQMSTQQSKKDVKEITDAK